ncbi:6-phosphogluconate dehydrogenase [Tenacibaculum skagerrakense]|uniref:6-phosphogluconate dehydrogenase, decarboxylating n=2 Tax=Tenacibaculum skagerrakense TaxID=186571 RepID=A0A4R2NQZ3_9FLAO|nr:6-phosphogluconate dehydrogenase [Tenacibaculum skagerrakense]
MGVSGCGKSTIGNLLSKRMEIPFIDADDFHPKTNIEKMSRGEALTDDDRLPWLQALNAELKTRGKSDGAILACSALKEEYRKVLSDCINTIQWVFLEGNFDLIKNRIEKRSNHFMDAILLQSQFDTLEIPNYGIKVSCEKSPEDITNEIIRAMQKSAFGIFGIGVMGKSLALNMLNKGISVSVYNRDEGAEKEMVENFLKETENKNVVGFTELKDFVHSLQTPRKILLMVKAGNVVDAVIDSIVPFLEEGDVLIDGGNSHYKDTERRVNALKNKQIHFVGLGVSGGEEGALKGPSLMPGGSEEGYNYVASYLNLIAAKDENGNPCCNYTGPNGAGHFVKMVHNGIEYADMQLLAELYVLLSVTKSYGEISAIFAKWNEGELSSYLLEITTKILLEKEGNSNLLDLILDKAGNKGTGSWSSVSALELGVPTTMKTAAVYARYISSFKETRMQLSKNIKDNIPKENLNINLLKQAYDFARTINLQQGLQLLQSASDEYNWNLNLSEICRIWSSGCIIKSEKIKAFSKILKTSNNLFKSEEILESLYNKEATLPYVIEYALKARISIPCFYEAYNYWVAMTTAQSSANMIQAQRDFFGAHKFQRVDAEQEKMFHHNWSC